MLKPLVTFLILTSISHFCKAQDFNYSTIDENLMDEVESSNDKWFDIYVILEDRVNIKALDQKLTRQKSSRKQRTKTIISALQSKAQNSQATVLKMLSQEGGVQNESITPYWLANTIFMRADKEALAMLSHDVRIEYIGLDGELELEEIDDEAVAVVEPNGVEIGLERINVRPLWEIGYTGYGRLALVADTGIDPTHNAFRSRYRGITNPENEAWYAYNNQPASPFQCGDHGTHVLGTVLGLDRFNRDTIGVAFDAQWLGSANLCGGGTQSNIGTFQWSLNPDNDQETTNDIPDVINNSWRDPSVGNSECNSLYVDILENLEALGVVVVFSAGNEGPNPETVTPPKNISINLVNVFSVGALNGGSPSLQVAGFSSRGPSVCEGEGSLAIKPEVSAPGVSVRSAELNNEYGLKSGTSMAAPHVSGAVLILRQAFPEVGARDIKLALYYTCRDLGIPGEDDIYGQGIIDVFAAYNYLIAEGFEPVAPASVENDIVVNEIITSFYECDGVLSPSLAVYNNSPNTILNTDILLSVEGDVDNALSTSWVGIIPPFTLDTIILDGLALPAGDYTLTVELSNPNGNIDDRALNNKLRKEVTVSEDEGLEILSVEDQVACEGANILVQSNYSGDGVVQWYDQLLGGNIIAEGVQAVVEAEQARTIYGGVLEIDNIGKIQTDSESIILNNEVGLGISFDVEIPLTITAVDFYSETPGNLIAALKYSERNNDGDLQDVQVYSDIISSDGSGWQTKELDWQLIERSGYTMFYRTGAAELGTVSSNIDYPYTIKDVMVVTRSVGTNSYPYFFNLQLQYENLCGRVELVVDALETDSLPMSDFEMDMDEIDLNSNQPVTFTNISTNGVSYVWDFGDGNMSEDENPTHIYSEPGTYYISLTTFNEDDCSDTFIRIIEVSSTTSIFGQVEIQNSFEVSPNPFTQTLNFKSDALIQVSRVELFSSAGLLVRSIRIDSRIAQHSQEIDDILPGLYYVLIHTESGVDTHKVVKH